MVFDDISPIVRPTHAGKLRVAPLPFNPPVQLLSSFGGMFTHLVKSHLDDAAASPALSLT